MMDTDYVLALVPALLLLAPVVAVSLAMTSNDLKVKSRGYVGLSAVLTLFAFGSFWMASSGQNRAGHAWMAVSVYGSYWAWTKARSFRSKL